MESHTGGSRLTPTVHPCPVQLERLSVASATSRAQYTTGTRATRTVPHDVCTVSANQGGFFSFISHEISGDGAPSLAVHFFIFLNFSFFHFFIFSFFFFSHFSFSHFSFFHIFLFFHFLIFFIFPFFSEFFSFFHFPFFPCFPFFFSFVFFFHFPSPGPLSPSPVALS